MTRANLIPISNGIIGDISQLTVDARLLHKILEVKRDFSTWIKGKISKYGFIENQDYRVFAKSGENLLGKSSIISHSPNRGNGDFNRLREAIEYELSMDMSKELCMVENNAKGKLTRRYFIECERKALSPQVPHLSNSCTRNPLKSLIDVWAKKGNLLYSQCYKQISSHFNLKNIKELPEDWLDDAIVFVQAKIKALPKAKQKALAGGGSLKAFGEKYNLDSYQIFTLGGGGIDSIISQNPNLGEHAFKVLCIKAKYAKALEQIYQLGKDLHNELNQASTIPILCC